MASQFLPTSTETSHGAHQLPEPAHVQPHIVQAPPSPPFSVKKIVSIFSPSSFEDHDSKRESPRCSAMRILSFQGPRRARLRLFYILAAFFILFCWWRSQTVQDFKSLKQRAHNLKKNLLLPPVLNDLHFVPASHQHIHYVGRWTHTPNRLRRDSSFPGAYLDFAVRNCSSVYASLYNRDIPSTAQKVTLQARESSVATRLEFRTVSEKTRRTAPVSLVSHVDSTEYQYFRQSGKGLVAITANLERTEDHIIRIIAAEMDGEGDRGVQFEGIWLNKGGSLVSLQRKKDAIWPQMDSVAPSMLTDESTQYSWQSSENNEVYQTQSSGPNHGDSEQSPLSPQKTLEIVTDVPSNLRGLSNHDSRAAVKGWEEMVGDMFGVDRVTITVDGMCLTSPCISGAAQPAGVKDVFFRSGLPGSTSFTRSWNFRSYIPDAVVLVLGSSDEASFRKHTTKYEKTMQDLRRQFEDTYVKFIRAIRRTAYPLHPAAFHDYSSNADGFVYNSAPATIPIFVVSPFTGEMSHSSQKVVEKLQLEGDKAVFWLDTSSWFSSADFDADAGDRVPDEKGIHLSSQGNRKAAVFLHGHLCHYLAEDQNQCPFLKHEAYTGKVYDPKDAELEKWMEESKIKKLKSLFWPESTERSSVSN